MAGPALATDIGLTAAGARALGAAPPWLPGTIDSGALAGGALIAAFGLGGLDAGRDATCCAGAACGAGAAAGWGEGGGIADVSAAAA